MKSSSQANLRLLGFCAIWVSGVLNSHGSPAVELTPVGQWQPSATNRSVQGVTVSGNQAYVSAGYDLHVLDISNPANPLRVGGLNMTGYVRRVVVSGSRAYVKELVFDQGSCGRLNVIDISDPSTPLLLGTLSTRGFSEDLEGHYGGMAVSGNYVYVTYQTNDISGLEIIDVSNPTNPVVAGHYISSSSLDILNSRSCDVAVSGNHAYFVRGVRWVGFHYWRTGGTFEVIDVSNPANPVSIRNTEDFHFASSVIAISGNHVYLSYGYEWHSGEYIATSGAGLQVYGLNPPSPVSVGWYGVSSYTNHLWNLGPDYVPAVVSGRYAFLHAAIYPYGIIPLIQVIDISDPTKPVRVGGDFSVRYVCALAASDNYLYVAGADGLQLFCFNGPRLSAELLAGQLLLKWPESATNFIIESSTTLSFPQWQAVSSGPPQLQDGFYMISVPTSGAATFFRLRRL